MDKTHMKNLKMAQMAILIALLAIMTYTPIGFLQIAIIAITLMHIPVIIGSVMMGPLCGGILGLAFGVLSMIKASTSAVSIVDMAFSPFLSGNPIASIIMCLVPRILLGVIAGLLYQWLSKKMESDVAAIAISAVVATFCHTIMVMGMLWLCFDALPLKEVIQIVVSLNSIVEMIAAALLASAVCKPLKRALYK